MPTTSNFSWTTPTVGGDAGSWGTILNDAIDDIDSDLDAVKTTADAAMPKAGGTFTGQIKTKAETLTGVNKSSMSGATELDLDDGDCFYGTVTAAITVTVANWPSSGTFEFVLFEITDGGSETVTWPGAIAWHENTEPTLQASGVDAIILYSRDGGTTIRGVHVYTDA